MPAPCEYCGRSGDTALCGRCDARVCPMHYHGPSGLCLDCADSASRDGRRGDGAI